MNDGANTDPTPAGLQKPNTSGRTTLREKRRGEGTLWLPKGSSVYWGTYYVNGKPQRFSTGKYDERKAQKMLDRRVSEGLTGSAPTEDVRRLRYTDLEAALVADYRANGRRSLRDLPHVLAPLRRAFDGVLALGISTAKMRAYSTARLDEHAAPATINKELGLLRRMLYLAHEDERITNVPAVSMLHVENARTGFVEPADFEALVAALPAHLQAPTRFAYLTGWRRGEVLGLTWDRIDLDSGTIRLDAVQTKTAKGRIFAFAQDSPLADLLHEQAETRRLDCPHVFHRNGQPLRYFYDSWRKACKAIGQPNLLFHDLRRSAVRNMVRAGVPERICMARSGHKTRSIFDRYNIVSEEDLREADTKVAAYLAANREPSKNRQSQRRVVALNEKREPATC